MKNQHEQGLPNIAVSPAEGKFLNLIKTAGAKRVLEVGTPGGYSAIWMAHALPADGTIVTLELDPHHAKVAEGNFKLAGFADRISVTVGPAAEYLAKLHPAEPFDFVFIDADKPSNLIYVTKAKPLVRPGGIVIVDNVVPDGRVADPEYSDASVEGVRTILKALKGDKEIEATTIATVGERGYYGVIFV